MQQLHGATVSPALDRCAAAVLDAGLLVSRFVRAAMWRHRPAGLSVVQFRALTFLNAHPDSGPSELAEYLMLSRPAATRLVDQLAAKKLLARRVDADDRRRLTLGITAAGRKNLDAYFAAARALVAERLASLPAAERDAVTRAMELLRPRFSGPTELERDDATPPSRGTRPA